MKRDMDVIRRILLEIEASETPYLNYNEREDVQHAVLLHDAGFIVGTSHRADAHGVILITVERLTWSGHEFLQSIRDDSLWSKAKEKVVMPGASWTVEVLKEWAKYEIKSKLGIPN